MKTKDLEKSYAVAFVHIPDGEVGRSEFVFDYSSSKKMCEELDSVCKTILHFPLAQGEDIQEKAKERKHGK